MIFDHIRNASQYYPLSPTLKSALAYLTDTDFSSAALGKRELEDGCLVNLQRYNTISEEFCCLEAHKRYIDIQFMIEGHEKIGYTHISPSKLIIDKSYDFTKDVIFYRGNRVWLPFSAGDFAIFFPGELHAPKAVLSNTPEKVFKAIMKIPLNI